jgi:hypothetical protein
MGMLAFTVDLMTWLITAGLLCPVMDVDYHEWIIPPSTMTNRAPPPLAMS